MTDVDTTTKINPPTTGDTKTISAPPDVQLGPRTLRLRDWSLAHDKTVWEQFIIRIHFLGLPWDETSAQFAQELGNFESLLPLSSQEEETTPINKSDTEAVKQLTREMEELKTTEAQIQNTDADQLVQAWITKLKKQGIPPKELESFEKTARQRFSHELHAVSQYKTPPDKDELGIRITNAAIASLNLPRDKSDGSYTREALGSIRQIQSDQPQEATDRVFRHIHNQKTAETVVTNSTLPTSKRVLLAQVLTAQIQTKADALLDIGETASLVQAVEAISQPLQETTGDKHQTNQYIDALTRPGWQRYVIKQISGSPLMTDEGRRSLVAKLSIASFEKTVEKAGIHLANAEITKRLFVKMQQSPPQPKSTTAVAQKAAGIFTDPFNAIFNPLAQAAATDDNAAALAFAEARKYTQRFGMAVFISPSSTIDRQTAQTTATPFPQQTPPQTASEQSHQHGVSNTPTQQDVSKMPTYPLDAHKTQPSDFFGKSVTTIDREKIPPGMIAVVVPGTNHVPPPIIYLPSDAANLPPEQIQQIALAMYTLQLLPQQTLHLQQNPQRVDRVLGITHFADQELFQWVFSGLKKGMGVPQILSTFGTVTNTGGFFGKALGFIAKAFGLTLDAALFTSTGGIGNVVKIVGGAVGKTLFLDKLFSGLFSVGGRLVSGLMGLASRPKLIDRRPWHQKIGLMNLLAIIPIAVLVLIFVPMGFLGIGLDMIVNIDPVTKLATAGIGGEDEILPIEYDGPIPGPSKIEGCPVPGGVITQGPFSDFSHGGHDAYDFGSLPVGTPITATHNGYVESYRNSLEPGEYRDNSFGNYVRLVGANENDQQFFTIYGHLLDVSEEVVRAKDNNTLITAGTVIGTLDATGYTMGYDPVTGRTVRGGGPSFIGRHLHYEYIGPGRLQLPAGCP